MKYEDIKDDITKHVTDNIHMVINHSNLSAKSITHIIDVATSIVVTRDGSGPMGGGFVQAIVANDLVRTVGSADMIAIRAIKLFVNIKQWYPYTGE